MADPRRSTRTRKQVSTIYTDALKETEKKQQQESQLLPASRGKKTVTSKTAQNTKDDGSAETDIEDEVTATEDDSQDDQESSEEEDFKPKRTKKPSDATKSSLNKGSQEDDGPEESSTDEKVPQSSKKSRKSVTPRKTTPTKGKDIATDPADDGRKNKSLATKAKTRTATTAHNKKLPTLMWNAFKKILDKEDCQDSLFASLLDTYRPGTTKTNHPAILLSNVYTQATDRRGDCVPYTEKTPETQASKLENLCASIMSLYSKDPNKAQCQLLNLIFRSVGCTSAKALSHQVHTLEDMDNDQWTLILTDLVEDMATSGKSAILLAADPKVGSSKSVNAIYSDCVTADQQVTREYRRIYGEFWYVFALASLSSEVSSSEHQHRVSLGTPNRFDAELVRDVILRVTELVSVGQPDIRAAACLAALQMGHAILDRTLHLTAKLGTATRQYEAFTKQKKSGEKAESLKIQIDNLKRTIDELEELVTGPIMNGIFMHRYRDSHPCIRSLCLSSLSKMSIQRQDIFLCDKYLKYFGWLMSDKAECVRYEALGGLLAPLEEADNRELDVTKLWHVTEKFLPRIADCTLDVCVQVQERAMKLLLFMVREGFLDNMDNDNIWNQINLRSIAEDTSDAVRRDSLYFIMEQLEAFDKDEEDVDTSKKSRRSSNKSLGSAIDSNERKAVLHLDAIASWVAHSLCDGDVPIEEIQIELADLIVNSVKNMPEHCHLMTNWGALIRAISDDSVATVGGATASDRVSVAKQRVLVRFLASAALSEVQLVAEPSFLSNGDDRRSPKRTKMGRSTTTPSSHPHETLSVALLKALPELLLKFKGDLEVLDDITTLPRYLLSSVFSLTQRRQEFSSLLKSLSHVFMHSSDERVLRNSAVSLAHFAEGDHSRLDNVRAELKSIVENLKKKVLDYLPKPLSRTQHISEGGVTEDSSDETSESSKCSKGKKEGDSQFSLSLAVKKLSILSKRCNISTYLGDENNYELISAISEGIKQRLSFFREMTSNDAEGSACDVLIALVQEGLSLILCCTSWNVKTMVDKELLLGSRSSDQLERLDDEAHRILAMRDCLIDVCEHCFETCLSEEDSDSVSDELNKNKFLKHLSRIANHVACDIRILFPKEWSQAASKNLRTLAIANEGKLIGGSVRCLRSEEDQLCADGEKGKDSILEFLCPISRSLITNWKGFGNRREAGIALSYLTGYSHETTAIVAALSKSLKRTDPVRLLEAHMACLRQLYDEWIDNEPQDIDDDHPSDEQMLAFETAEKAHKEQFIHVEQLALRLSQSLGVAKLENKLMPAIIGFLREGIRFSFSSDEDDDLILGSRLSFLPLVEKYLVWIKRLQAPMRDLGNELTMREQKLRAHSEFQEVHDDDLKALSTFREALGIKTKHTDKAPTSENIVTPGKRGSAARNTKLDSSGDSTPSEYIIRSDNISTGKRSSIASVQSKLSSIRSSLSPLQEQHSADSSDEDSTYAIKKASIRESQSTLGASQYTLNQSTANSDDETSYARNKQFRVSRAASGNNQINQQSSTCDSVEDSTHASKTRVREIQSTYSTSQHSEHSDENSSRSSKKRVRESQSTYDASLYTEHQSASNSDEDSSHSSQKRVRGSQSTYCASQYANESSSSASDDGSSEYSAQ